MQFIEMCLLWQAMLYLQSSSFTHKIVIYLIPRVAQRQRLSEQCRTSSPFQSLMQKQAGTDNTTHAEEEDAIGAVTWYWDPALCSRLWTQPLLPPASALGTSELPTFSQRAAFGLRGSTRDFLGSQSPPLISQGNPSGSGERCDAVRCPFEGAEDVVGIKQVKAASRKKALSVGMVPNELQGQHGCQPP